MFNIGIGFAVAWAGCVLMFLGEERREFDEEAEFRRSSKSSEVSAPASGVHGSDGTIASVEPRVAVVGVGTRGSRPSPQGFPIRS